MVISEHTELNSYSYQEKFAYSKTFYIPLILHYKTYFFTANQHINIKHTYTCCIAYTCIEHEYLLYTDNCKTFWPFMKTLQFNLEKLSHALTGFVMECH